MGRLITKPEVFWHLSPHLFSSNTLFLSSNSLGNYIQDWLILGNRQALNINSGQTGDNYRLCENATVYEDA